MEVSMDRLLLRVGEVAEIMGISRSTAYELIRRGVIPAARVGRSVRVRPEDLRTLAAKLVEEFDEEGERRLIVR